MHVAQPRNYISLCLPYLSLPCSLAHAEFGIGRGGGMLLRDRGLWRRMATFIRIHWLSLLLDDMIVTCSLKRQ